MSLETNTLLLLAGMLMLIGIVASTLTVRIGLPFLLLFLAVGMLAGEEGIGRIPFDNFDLAFLVGNLSLAVILLDGGMRTQSQTFRAALWPSITLSSLGVILTAGIVGIFAAWLLQVDIWYGLLLGAIVGSTDAAAVFNLLRNGGIQLNDRVGGTLEIESGINDPMAIFLVLATISLLTGATEPSFFALAKMFLTQFLLGGLLGWIGGHLLSLLLRHISLAEGLNALLIVSFGLVVFAGVNWIGGSGFLAIYLVGLVVGNHRVRPSESVSQIMDGLAWLAQAGMFLILGLLVTPTDLLAYGTESLAVAAFLFVVARPLATVISLLPFRFRWRERAYISWVGLRGAVPIVLAIYPVMAGLPNSQLIFDITFAVVLVSLLIQGSTVPLMARWLKVVIPPSPAPVKRHPLIQESALNLELSEFQVQKGAPALSTQLFKGQHEAANPQCVALIRSGRPLEVNGAPDFQEGDRVWMLLRSEDVEDVARQFSGQARQGVLATHNFYGEFVLKPDAQVQDLIATYGVQVEEAELAFSLSGLLLSRLGKHPVVGDRIRLGPLRLTIRQMDGDAIVAIGLKLVPR